MEIKEYLEAKLRSIAQGEIRWEGDKLYLSGKWILEVFYSPPPGFQVLFTLPYYIRFNMYAEEGRKLALSTDLYYFTAFKGEGRKIEVLYGPMELLSKEVVGGGWSVQQHCAVRSIYKAGKFEVWEVLRPFGDWEYIGFFKEFYASYLVGRRRLAEEKAIWKMRGLLKEKVAEAKYRKLKNKPLPRIPIKEVSFKPNPKCPRKSYRCQELFRLLSSLRKAKKEFVEGVLLGS